MLGKKFSIHVSEHFNYKENKIFSFPYSSQKSQMLLKHLQGKTSELPMRAIQEGRQANRFQDSNFTG